MSNKRDRLWHPEMHKAYWKQTDAAARRAVAAKHGEQAAEEIDQLWGELEEQERALLEMLLLKGRRSLVARHDNELCNGLVDKRLLQIPPGVGTLLMQDLETTFKVPRAVWRELTERRESFVPSSEPAASERLAEVTRLVDLRLRDSMG